MASAQSKADELRARVYSQMVNLTIREADQFWQFLWYVYQNPFTEVNLKPVEGNSTGSCLGEIHLSPVSTFTISRPCGDATILWGSLDQMVTRVRNEAYSDARLKPPVEAPAGRVRDHLGALLIRGNELNRTLSGESSLTPWVVEVDSWTEETATYIREHLSIADAALFSDTAHGPGMQFPHAVNPDHNKRLSKLTRQLTNLRSIIERHSTTGSLI